MPGGMPGPNGTPFLNNVMFPNAYIPKEVTKMTKAMQKEYWHYIGMAVLFAALFVFCLYKNVAGITAPGFAVGALGLLYHFAKKNDIEIKKVAIPASVAIVGFAVSCFLTDNEVIIFYNYIAGIFLIVLLFLNHVYDTDDWNVNDYVSQIFFLCFGGIMENILGCFPMYQAYKKEYADKKEGGKKAKWLPVVIGGVCALPVVLIVGGLLVSSDVVFGTMSEEFLGSFLNIEAWFDDLFGIVFWFVIAFVVFYALLLFVANNKEKTYQVKHGKKRDSLLAVGFLSPLLILYAVFSWVQVGALFLGKMQLPEGYSYSEYAREGFWQLLFVCIVNLGIVLLCYSCFMESKALKSVQTLMIVCTYIMLLSAGFRMGMYVDAYGLTRKRVYVFWGLTVLAVLFIGVGMAVWKRKFPLFRFGTTVVLGMYLLFSLSHVDYWIGYYNLFVREDLVEMENDWGGNISAVDYLQGALSLDVAPVVADYYETTQEEMSDYYVEKVEDACENMGPRTFNLSRWIAGKNIK